MSQKNALGRFADLNPFGHIKRIGPMLTSPQNWRESTVTTIIVADWRNDLQVNGEGDWRDMITARVKVNPRHSMIMVAENQKSWQAVPVTIARLFMLSTPIDGEALVEIRANTASRSLFMTFTFPDMHHVELVKQSTGKFALRFMITFRAVIADRRLMLTADRKYVGRLDAVGPYQPLGDEPLLEFVA